MPSPPSLSLLLPHTHNRNGLDALLALWHAYMLVSSGPEGREL